MSETSEADAAAALAQRYLSLWTEYWASCLNAPETAALVAQILKPLGGDGGVGLNAAFAQYAPRSEPTSLPTAPDAGGSGADELESRIAALERRLAAYESGAQPRMAEPSRKPRSRSRKT